MVTRSDPTEQNDKNVHPFLDYIATYLNELVRFHALDMILRKDTNASYLTEPQARGCDSGYFLLDSIPPKYSQGRLNGPIHVNCNILKMLPPLHQKQKPGDVL